MDTGLDGHRCVVLPGRCTPDIPGNQCPGTVVGWLRGIASPILTGMPLRLANPDFFADGQFAWTGE